LTVANRSAWLSAALPDTKGPWLGSERAVLCGFASTTTYIHLREHMNFISIIQLQSLPYSFVVVFALLAVCVIGGVCILTYVGVHAAFDARSDNALERTRRDMYLAEQSRIYLDRNGAAPSHSGE
jgi:hypothetical protein